MGCGGSILVVTQHMWEPQISRLCFITLVAYLQKYAKAKETNLVGREIENKAIADILFLWFENIQPTRACKYIQRLTFDCNIRLQ